MTGIGNASRRALSLATLAALLLCCGASGEEPRPATDARGLFLQGLAGSPALRAAVRRADAAACAARAAGRLGDPMVGFGYTKKSNAMTDWPMYEVSLEQPLPRWGERAAMRGRAAAEADMAEAETLAVAGDLAAEVATLLAGLDAARARLALLDAQVARLAALQAGLDVRSAAGSAGLAEALGVRVRATGLAVARADAARQVADAGQELRARLGLPPEAPLPPFAAPEADAVDLARIPGVLAGRAGEAEAEAMRREARAGRRPETAIGLNWSRERVPDDTMDSAGVMLRVSLPLRRAAANRLEEAALGRAAAARNDAEDRRLAAEAALGRARRAVALAAAASAAARENRGRLEAQGAALLRAAAGGGADLAAALDLLERVAETELAAVDAEEAARQAAAGLWRLAPPDTTDLDRSLP